MTDSVTLPPAASGANLSMAPFVLGIDLGATSVKVGLMRDDRLIAKEQFVTAGCAEPADVFERTKLFAKKSLADQGCDLSDLHAVGLAMAGVIDDETATLMETANLHDWHGIGFYQELSKVFDRPVAVINDANAAALGEFAHGAQQPRSLALLTLGTGIGCGIILGGRPVNGNQGCGGELGHIPIEASANARPCGCGRSGHLEAYAGAAGIVQTARELMIRDRKSLLHDMEPLSPAFVAEAAEKGDPVAMQTVKETSLYLGHAIAMLGQVVDPELVLLGGAVTFGGHQTQTGRDFLRTITDEMKRLSLVQVAAGMRIDFATLGNDAGMLGAASHARTVTKLS